MGNYVSLPFFVKSLANVWPNQIRFLKIMYPWLRIQATPKRRLENPSLTIGICWIYVSSSSLLLLNICTLFLVYVLCYMYKHRIEVTLILFLRKKCYWSPFFFSQTISHSLLHGNIFENDTFSERSTFSNFSCRFLNPNIFSQF